jgi:hypothetical protein
MSTIAFSVGYFSANLTLSSHHGDIIGKRIQDSLPHLKEKELNHKVAGF